MSQIEKQVPPAGEEIHLPGGSIQPLLLALGITVAVVGITTSIVLVIGGSILALWTMIRWIQDTRRDIEALPASHGDEH